ncbi:UNVERIFIED_CONTAM: hypothetical protein FKN15_008984 [Acipenser sinensis]
MQKERAIISPLLSGVFCQCGSDPGGGAGTAVSEPHHHCSDAHASSAEFGSGSCGGALCGAGTEQEHRLKVLFQVLDVNKDGGICVNDLTIGLKKLGVHRTENELR